jgi:hypothetical protein
LAVWQKEEDETNELGVQVIKVWKILAAAEATLVQSEERIGKLDKKPAPDAFPAYDPILIRDPPAPPPGTSNPKYAPLEMPSGIKFTYFKNELAKDDLPDLSKLK